MGRTGGSFQRLVQQEGLLVDVVALTAAAVRIARVVGLRVVLREEGGDAAGTFRGREDGTRRWRREGEKLISSDRLLLAMCSSLFGL